MEAGCDFLTTQMFFDNDMLYSFLYRMQSKGRRGVHALVDGQRRVAVRLELVQSRLSRPPLYSVSGSPLLIAIAHFHGIMSGRPSPWPGLRPRS